MAHQRLAILLWKAAWIAVPFAFLGYLAFGFHADPPPSANPLRPKTWQEAERQVSVASEERSQRKFWIEQVETGAMSFEEAGCGYRGGEWVSRANHCNTEPFGQLP